MVLPYQGAPARPSPRMLKPGSISFDKQNIAIYHIDSNNPVQGKGEP